VGEQFKEKILDMDIGGQSGKILAELGRAMDIHPLFPCDPIHAVNIMMEEAGESARAVNQLVHEGGTIEALKDELIQTAAMCIRVLCGIESGDIVKGEEAAPFRNDGSKFGNPKFGA